MIANITQGSFLNGLLEYNNKKVEEEEAAIFHSNIINRSDINIKRVFNNLMKNSKRKDRVFHISLNFLAKDYETLGAEKLKLLAEDYLKEIGFPENHPFLSYMHFDKKHPHIHIVTSKILEDNKVLDDKFIFRKSYRISRKLEKKYNITPINEHYKINRENKINKKQINKALLVEQYKKKKIPLNTLFNQFALDSLKYKKPINIIEYKDNLLEYNIHLEQTKFTNKGLIYRFEDDTSGIKSSNLEKALRLKELNKIFEINKKEQKFVSSYIGKQIDYLFFKYDKLNYQTYIEELAKKNIIVKANITNGVIRGFRYEYNGFSLKGQQLPKRAYTMSKIQDKFTDNNTINEVFFTNYKIKFNKDKINNNSLLDFIKSSLKIGLVPLLTDKGIYLRRPNDYLLNLLIKEDLHIDINYNEILKSLSPEQIKTINDVIKEQILEEKIEIEKENKNDLIISNFDFLDEFINILEGEDYREISDENISNNSKKKKRKKRRL